MGTSEILYSDHHGIYIPQMFGKDCASSFNGINFEDIKVLIEGPEHEHYWDAWDAVLSDASIVRHGVEYMLHQDGDLWLVKAYSACQDEINERVEEYVESMYESEQSDDMIGEYFNEMGDQFMYYEKEVEQVLIDEYDVPKEHVEAVVNGILNDDIPYTFEYHSQGFPFGVNGAILSVCMSEFEWDCQDLLEELSEEYSFYCSDQSIEHVFDIDYLSDNGMMYYNASYDVISLQCEQSDIDEFINNLNKGEL